MTTDLATREIMDSGPDTETNQECPSARGPAVSACKPPPVETQVTSSSSYRQWKDVGMDTYSSEYESGTLTGFNEVAVDSGWLASGETKAKEPVTFHPRSHTITLLAILLVGLAGAALLRTNADFCSNNNVVTGVLAASSVLLAVGTIAFPTGPFTYPHPVVWRLLFGGSILYLLTLTFVLFQDYHDVSIVLEWFFGGRGGVTAMTSPDHDGYRGAGPSSSPDDYEACAVSSSDAWLQMSGASSAARQVLGWTVKALVVRDSSILWVLNVLQEVTELYLGATLPVYAHRRWWSLGLNAFVFNALGIHAGMYICKKLEVMELQWEVKSSTASSRLKRAVLQITPEAWSSIRWLDLSATYYRCFCGAVALLLGVQLMTLNGIYLQLVFQFPPDHVLVAGRTTLLCLIGAPSVQQLYLYITGRSYGRLGSQCWVYFAIVLSELLIIAKYGASGDPAEGVAREGAALLVVLVLSSAGALVLLAAYQKKGYDRVPYRRRKLFKKRRRSYRMQHE